MKKILYVIGGFFVFLFVIGLADPTEQNIFEVNSNLSGLAVASLEKKDITGTQDIGKEVKEKIVEGVVKKWQPKN